MSFSTYNKRDSGYILKVQGARVTSDTNPSAGLLFRNYNDLSKQVDDLASITAISTTMSESDTNQVDVSGDMFFSTKESDDNDLIERMRMKSNGFIGLNTEYPQCTLDIRGDLNVSGTINGSTATTSSTESNVPTGTMTSNVSDTVPTGYVKPTGQLLSRTEYPELFDLIGTKYGDGDGSTMFALPTIPDETVQILMGNLMIIGTDDGRLLKVDLSTNTVSDNYSGQSARINAVCIIDDYIVSGDESGSLHKVRLDDMTFLESLTFNDPVTHMTVNNDSTFLFVLTTSQLTRINIFNAFSIQQSSDRQDAKGVLHVGRYLYVAEKDKLFRLNGTDLQKIDESNSADGSEIRSITTDGVAYIFASHGYSVSIFNVANRMFVVKDTNGDSLIFNHLFDQTINSVAYAGDKTLFCFTSDNVLIKLNIDFLVEVGRRLYSKNILSMVYFSSIYLGFENGDLEKLTSTFDTTETSSPVNTGITQLATRETQNTYITLYRFLKA